MKYNKSEQIAELVERHGRMVFATAYRILGNAEDSEDVLQEVFLKMLGNGLKADTVRDWGAYLRVVASRTAVDLLRRQRSRKENLNDPVLESGSLTEGLETQTSPYGKNPRQEAIRRQRAGLLRQALRSLPKRDARIFALRYFEDFSYEEIGEHLGIQVNRVGVILHRTRERLQKILEPFVSSDADTMHLNMSEKENSRVAE